MKEYSETFSADGDGAVYAVRKTGHPGNEPVGFVAAGTFGGGGHPRAAGCTVEGDLEEARAQILGAVRREMGCVEDEE